MSECITKSRLKTGFNRLSKEKKSEILGMAEAFIYAQKEQVAGAIIWTIAEDARKEKRGL
jgi:hypothetical protein